MMHDFQFRYGPRVICSAGASARLADTIPDGPVLFVTDEQLLACGLVQPAIDALRDAGRDVILFDAVEADPSRKTLEAAVAAGRAGGAAAVIGFGGGSPMDVAKLAAYLIGSGDDLDDIWGVEKATGTGLPLILVPTTAGTGSEATQISIITLSESEKRGVSSAALLADIAILDPALTTGLPRHISAATGIDAIVHAIEAFTSARLKNPMSDMLAREALRLLSANLLTSCEAPQDLSGRAAMMLGAHLAGVAFANAPVAGVHALAYPLGTRFHVPHGLSNALMLPHVMRFNMPAAASLYAEIAPIVAPSLASSNGSAAAEGLVAALTDMVAATGLALRLRDVGVAEEDLDTLAADAMLQDRLLLNNPRPISVDDARSLYEAAL